ncbi:uncharacterized protein LOC111133408 isoform X1 [Crassostrea virginica]
MNTELPISLVWTQFSTNYAVEHENHVLAISGSLPALGQWNARKAVLADEYPENSGKWIVTVSLPANVKFEWKWVVIWRKNHTAFRWEERGNRVTELGDQSCSYYAPWNGEVSSGTISQVPDGQWSNVDNEQVEKLAEDPAGLTEPCTHPEVGLISSYLREVGFLVTWSLQSIRSGVVAFFRMIGAPFWRDNTHDHVD